MKRLLALGTLALLAATVAWAGTNVTSKMAQSNLADSDSLSATADTSSAITLRGDAAALRVVAWSDSVMIYKTQVRPPGGTTWVTVDVDTTAAAVVENTGDLTAAYAGWDVRVILDGLWATGKKNGQAYISWSK